MRAALVPQGRGNGKRRQTRKIAMSDGRKAREERLAQALRANLARRKAQARGRREEVEADEPAPPPPPATPSPEGRT